MIGTCISFGPHWVCLVATSNMSTSPLESRILGIVDRQIEITEQAEYDRVSEGDDYLQLFISFKMECGTGLRQCLG